jgi:hypothetical protein
LILDAKHGVETSAEQCAEAGGLQFQTRAFELRREGWPIKNRLDRSTGRLRSFYRIDLEELRRSGRADLLALVSPDQSPTAGTFPEFGALAPESYGVD